jgi:hypothetical protein
MAAAVIDQMIVFNFYSNLKFDHNPILSKSLPSGIFALGWGSVVSGRGVAKPASYNYSVFA